MTTTRIQTERTYVGGFGWLTDYEAQRAACKLWDSLTYQERRAIEATGVEGQILTHSGAEGLLALRAAAGALRGAVSR